MDEMARISNRYILADPTLVGADAHANTLDSFVVAFETGRVTTIVIDRRWIRTGLTLPDHIFAAPPSSAYARDAVLIGATDMVIGFIRTTG